MRNPISRIRDALTRPDTPQAQADADEPVEAVRTVRYVNRDEDSYQDLVDRGQIHPIDPAEEREWWIRHDALYDWQDQTWPPATRHPDEDVLAPFIAAQRIKHAALDTVEAATEADYRASRALLEEPPAAPTHQQSHAHDHTYDHTYGRGYDDDAAGLD